MSACGGSADGGRPLGPDQGKGPIMTLALLNGNGSGQEITDIPAGSVGLLTATVFDAPANGKPVPSVFVTFSITQNPTAGTLSSTSAVTQANGVATVTVTPGSPGQSGNITATATVGTTVLTDSIGFTASN